MRLSKAQQRYHWALWKRVTAVLFPNSAIRVPQSELDAKRHALYIEATGEELSLTEMNNAQFDLVKGAMLAIVEPGNLNAQFHALNGQRKRLLFGIRKLAASICGSDFRLPNSEFSASRYVAGIVKTMNAEGKLGSDDLEELHPRELTKVMIALRKQSQRSEVGGRRSEKIAEPAEAHPF